MQRRSSRAALGICAVVLIAVAASPAGAQAAPASLKPDGRIRLQKVAYELFDTEKYSGDWIGEDVYNETGSRQKAQTLWSDVTPGWQRWVFAVSVQNDGASNDRFRVHATGDSLNGWAVRYFDGTTNVTAAVRNGTFTTPTLGHGDAFVIKVKITRDAENFDIATLRRLITSTSISNPNKSDAVKLVLKRQVCSC
jgi:hypothetical protein